MNVARLGETIRDAAADALAIPELEFIFSDSFSAARPGFRERIRGALAARFPSESARMRDLSQVPRHAEFSISISHDREYGGVAIVPLPSRVGFDIEETGRVTQAIAERVRGAGDAPAPSPAHLWVAKEATFKCQFLGHQPKTSTQIAIQEWTGLTSKIFLFRATPLDSGTDPAGYGAVIEHHPHLACFFIDRSQLASWSADRLVNGSEPDGRVGR